MFREIVGQVGVAWSPEYIEMTLFDAVADPVESHVDGFGSALFDRVVGDPACGGIVGLHWCCRLWPVHFF